MEMAVSRTNSFAAPATAKNMAYVQPAVTVPASRCSRGSEPARNSMIRHSRWWALAFALALSILSALCSDDAKPPTGFSEHLIADKYDYAYGLAAVDIDGDGDLDLTSVDIRNKTAPVGKQRSALYRFENDGRGKFQKR